MRHAYGEPSNLRRALLPGILATLLALGLILTACQQPATNVKGAQPGVTIDQVLANPQQYYGQTVAMDANVQSVIGERVVVLGSQSGSPEMLAVLSDHALQAVGTVQSGEALRVVGTVQPLTREQLQEAEQQLGVALDVDQLLSLTNQAPFVIVENASK